MARTVVSRICEICSNQFNARPYQVKIGDGRFCSRTCRALGQPRESLEKRFWNKVDTSGGSDACWNWIAFRNSDGYGIIGTGGKSNQAAHRVSYLLNVGTIPDGYRVLHRCDNPSCCNPSHLFLGTQADNVADMVQKKRNVAHKGEKAPRAKLSFNQVQEIKAKYSGKRGEKLALSREYGVCIQTICNILNETTWNSHNP